jgi:hypothetical protein
VVTFNPQAPAAKTPTSLPGYVYGLACFDTTHCTTLAGAVGDEESFNPQSPGTPSPASVDPHNGGMTGVACPAQDECIAVDVTGHEVMFDPSAPGTPTPQTVLSGGQEGSEPTVSCPVGTQQCTELDGFGGELTFDPQSPGSPNDTTIDRGAYLLDLACGSSAQCTALEQPGPMEEVNLGQATFNPLSPGPPSPTVIEDNTSGTGLACPLPTQCTVTDGGNELTFNPGSPASPTGIPVETGGGEAEAIACSSPAQCTVVDNNGGEVTFNPQAPGTPARISVDGSGQDLIGLACPSAIQCTAITGFGGELTFDPQSPESGTLTSIDAAGGTTSIACPAATQCTAVDSHGKAVTFDPQAPSHATAPAVDPSGGGLLSVACPKQDACVAVNDHNDAVVGDPTSSAPWELEPVPGAGGLTAVACPSAGECVATDARGQEITGIDAAPVNTGLPTVAGGAVQGLILSATHGSWAYGPTRFAYQWEDCSSAGVACTAIPGATAPTYRLAARDIGHTVRVRVLAANDVGGGGPVSSAATRVVAGDVGVLVLYSAKASGAGVRARIGCRGLTGQSCRITTKLSVTERVKKRRRSVPLGARTVTLKAGSRRTLKLALNRTGRRLLSRSRHLSVAVAATQAHSKRHARRRVKLSSKRKR